eukprot:TRINITY_DN8650_c0_g1_i1.p1 TRINITY_DN8650_c0_g1~~TRINITY_DN8650_c0_g1_i1.p1  ORF type:complete len:237 (-),score=48.41 TRINITY_DN8650_c0_g1_i1:20-730(-)
MMSLKIGYWKIRGLAAALRMMCHYAGVEHESVLYEVKEKEGGGWDHSSWFSVKPELKEKNALINLPYVQDGETLVTLTNACLLYLGRKFNLNGKDAEEQVKVEQILMQIMDLRNEATGGFYGPKEKFQDNIKREYWKDHYQKFELWLQQNKTDFVASNEVTTPDFHLFEMLDQHETLSKFLNFQSPLSSYPLLSAYYQRMKSLPKLAGYLSSDIHRNLPINQRFSNFGISNSAVEK